MPRDPRKDQPSSSRPDERPFFDFYQFDAETFVVAFYPTDHDEGREVCVVAAYGEPPDDDAPRTLAARNWRTAEEAESQACEIASTLNAGLLLAGLVRS